MQIQSIDQVKSIAYHTGSYSVFLGFCVYTINTSIVEMNPADHCMVPIANNGVMKDGDDGGARVFMR